MAGKIILTLLVLGTLAYLAHGSTLSRREWAGEKRERAEWAATRRLARGEEYDRRQRDMGEPCNNPADIVFVLDESGSIWGPHFTMQLKFVMSVIDSFNVNFNHTHIGVETFGDNPRVSFVLGEFTGADALRTEVLKIGQHRGDTATDEALQTMRAVMFNPSYTRPWVPHIGIVITDGESNDPHSTELQAMLAKEAGINMFAVGIGDSVNRNELQAIATSDDQVFSADSYDFIDSLKDILAWKACQVTTLPPPSTTTTPTTTTTTTTTTTPAPTTTRPMMIEACSAHTPMDIVFSIPDQAGIINTEYSLEFVQKVVEEFNLGPEQVQAGLTPRYCDDAEGIHLREYDSTSGFTGALGQRLLGATRTDWQLEYLMEEAFHVDNGGREDSAKYGVLVVDNSSDDLEETLRVAAAAKDQGIRLIVIGVGGYVDFSELSQIASSDEDWYHVDSYEELSALQDDLLSRICEGLEEPSRGDTLRRHFG